MAKRTVNLAASGGPASITVAELVSLAAQAKTKVKARARGASTLSLIEILALAWLADVILEDAELTNENQKPFAAEPAVISQV